MHARCRCHTAEPAGVDLRPLVKYIVAVRPGIDKRSLFRAVYLIDKGFEKRTGKPLTGTNYGHCMLLKAPYFSVDVKDALFELLNSGEIELRAERDEEGRLVSTYRPVGYGPEDVEPELRRAFGLSGPKWRIFEEVLERALP